MSEDRSENPTHYPESLSESEIQKDLDLLAQSARDLSYSPEQAQNILSQSREILAIARENPKDPDTSQKRLARIAAITVPLTLAFAAAFFLEKDGRKDTNANKDTDPNINVEKFVPTFSGAGAIASEAIRKIQTSSTSVTPKEYEAQFEKHTVQEGENIASIIATLQPDRFLDDNGKIKDDPTSQLALNDRIQKVLAHNRSQLEEQNKDTYRLMDETVTEKGRRATPEEFKSILEQTGGENQVVIIQPGQVLTIPKQ